MVTNRWMINEMWKRLNDSKDLRNLAKELQKSAKPEENLYTNI